MYRYAVHKMRTGSRRWEIVGNNGTQDVMTRAYVPKAVKVDVNTNNFTDDTRWSEFETLYFETQDAAMSFARKEATLVPGVQFVVYNVESVYQTAVGDVVTQRMTDRGLVPA